MSKLLVEEDPEPKRSRQVSAALTDFVLKKEKGKEDKRRERWERKGKEL